MECGNDAAHGAIGIEFDAGFHEARRAERHFSGHFEKLQNPSGIVFAFLDVGFIKRIDTERRAGQSGHRFPLEEFGTQLRRRFQPNLHERRITLIEGPEGRVQPCRVIAFKR